MGSPVRLVFFLDSLGIGGTEMNAVRVAERLDRSRFHVSFACLNGSGALRERILTAGIAIDVFPVGSIQGPGYFREGRRFRRFLVSERVDIVHAHDRYANMFAVPWARVARVPAIIASKRWGSISTRHGIANRFAFKLAHRVLANSSAVGASLTSEDGVPPAKIVVVPNFVDDHAFAPPDSAWLAHMRAELALDDDAMVVGIVANLRLIKDHATLVRAVATLAPRFPKLVLVMIGSGDQLVPLEELAASLGIRDRVRFAGTRPNRPNPNVLFDVCVLCSVSEGFPNTIVEAMAAGRPVVATRVGGVPDAVDDGHTGMLVAPRDPAALALALEALLSDAGLRATMGSAGRAKASAEFGAEEVIHSLESLYDNLIAQTLA